MRPECQYLLDHTRSVEAALERNRFDLGALLLLEAGVPRVMTAPVSRTHRLQRVRFPVRTHRMTLRLPELADVPDLKRMFRNPLTARAAGAPLHSKAEMRDPVEMVHRTRREFRADAHLSLSVILNSSSACIGRVGLRGLDWKWKKVESLSYWLDPRYWDQGLTTEASWFLCRLAFGRLNMRRIGSQALDGNPASQAVLRRLGFVEEGRERAAVCVKGRSMDMVWFGLLAEELRPLGDRSGPPVSRAGPA